MNEIKKEFINNILISKNLKIILTIMMILLWGPLAPQVIQT